MTTSSIATPRTRTAPGADGPAHRPSAVRRAGALLVVGALAFASVPFVGDRASQAVDVVSGVFQIGIWGLLLTMWRTGATGTSRAARAMLVGETVVLALASVASVLLLLPDAVATSTPVLVLDVFWPISMLGMAAIGVKVALAGRWRGALRYWPLVAETWVLVTLPAMALLGDTAGLLVGSLHLLVGYATLGVLLLARPDLTRPDPTRP